MRVAKLWLGAFCCSLLLATGAQAKEETLPSKIELSSWKVPWDNTRPRDPAVDSKGNVWFCGQQGNYIAKLDPKTGKFKRFELSRNTNPHNLIIDDRDMVWYAGNKNGHIGKLDPITGNITRYTMPDKAASDPHTLIQSDRGDIWFTVQWGNFVGKLKRLSGSIDLYPVPTKDARPYGIKMDKSGQPWVALLGTNKLATVKDGDVVEFSLPRAEARPRRLEISKDGMLWYVDYATGYLGQFNPNDQSVEEWQLPSGSGAKPYGTALDKNGTLWIADTAEIPNTLYGFDTKAKAFVSQTDVDFGGHIRHTFYNPKSDKVWFGTDSGYIGNAAPAAE